MTAPLTVESILKNLQNSHDPTVKVAAVAETNTLGAVASQRGALDAALAQLNTAEKTAAETIHGYDAVAYLEKTAAQIEQAEAEALLKEASLFGAAVWDAFLVRGNEFAKLAAAYVPHQQAQVAETAAQSQPTIEDHIKVASVQGAQDTYLVLQAAAEEEKVAAQQYAAQDTDDTLEKIAELCHHSFNQGFAHVDALLRA